MSKHNTNIEHPNFAVAIKFRQLPIDQPLNVQSSKLNILLTLVWVGHEYQEDHVVQ